ncbi:MAG: thiamine diphosphokinase [Treponema sp.]|jgi:thiamine pyrophosphokinase|nr:thiamine diphosphokinase [Treponema sp.]
MTAMTAGILFTGGEAPAPAKTRALLAELARERKLLTAAADSGLLAAEAAGFVPDWIVGDMDSLPAERLAAYTPERVIRYPADKDFTDTELAFRLLEERGCAEVYIIGGGGGRMDQLYGIRSLFERENPPRRWYTAGEAVYCLDAPAALTLPADSRGAISVFPLGNGPWRAASGGLFWPLAPVRWNRGGFGLSNRPSENAEIIGIEALSGRFMIIVTELAELAERE